jgi:hypothetical protein
MRWLFNINYCPSNSEVHFYFTSTKAILKNFITSSNTNEEMITAINILHCEGGLRGKQKITHEPFFGARNFTYLL